MQRQLVHGAGVQRNLRDQDRRTPGSPERPIVLIGVGPTPAKRRAAAAIEFAPAETPASSGRVAVAVQTASACSVSDEPGASERRLRSKRKLRVGSEQSPALERWRHSRARDRRLPHRVAKRQRAPHDPCRRQAVRRDGLRVVAAFVAQGLCGDETAHVAGQVTSAVEAPVATRSDQRWVARSSRPIRLHRDGECIRLRDAPISRVMRLAAEPRDAPGCRARICRAHGFRSTAYSCQLT